jgi:hypothetical protein
MNRSLIYLLLPAAFGLFLVFGFTNYSEKDKVHFYEEQSEYHYLAGELPALYNELFAGAGVCLQCHNEQVNEAGESVSIIGDWRASMMANSSKDPFWRAKVSHEGLVNPAHKEELENVCTRCHAPAGNENAHHMGQALYSIEDMVNDPIALDGVQCTVCHQITESSLGQYSGNFGIGTEKKIWGPYEAPFTTPMFNHTGYTPTYSDHINDSRICGSCHTLITNSVDNSGFPTGNEFVEQSIYHEWLNSDFPESGTTCQTCHMPRIDDDVVISTMPPWLEPRTPFGLHHFAGANVFMLNILKENGEELGLTAEDVHFDSAIVRNSRMLQQQTIDFLLTEVNRTSDTLYLKLEISNQAGHKFPSGYPSRRAFVELLVKNDNDQTIFHSGEMDENFQLINEDESFEPHYLTINSEDQVQIYEMVMGDINHDVTTVLERANFNLKDNRIPPTGFTTAHFAYDTVAIVGNASIDNDFNKSSGMEGTGTDVLYFNIPTASSSGELSISAKLHYKTVSAKWLEHMFSYSSEEIDLFKGYFEDANKEPVLVAASDLTSLATSIQKEEFKPIQIYPNPTSGKVVLNVNNNSFISYEILSNSGQTLSQLIAIENELTQIHFPEERGLYYLRIYGIGVSHVEKIVVY